MTVNYVDEKTRLISTINIVPLVGIFAALLIVIMLAIPSNTNIYTSEWIRGCIISDRPHEHKVQIHIDSHGQAIFDNTTYSNSDITDIIGSMPKHSVHQFVVEIDADDEASYQDLMSLIVAVHKSGLEENNIRILDNRWQ